MLKGTDTKLLGALKGDALEKSLGLGGAGRFNYFESLKARLANSVLEVLGPSAETDPTVTDRFELFIEDFYQKNVLCFPDKEQEDLEVSTLAVTWAYGRGKIWASDRMAVRESDDLDVIGYGSTYPYNLLRAYYRKGVSVESLVILAAYFVWRTKITLLSIGQGTQVMIVGDSRVDHVPDTVIQKLNSAFETKFETYHSCLGNMFGYISGVEDVPYFENAVSGFKGLRVEFDRTRQLISAIRSASSHT